MRTQHVWEKDYHTILADCIYFSQTDAWQRFSQMKGKRVKKEVKNTKLSHAKNVEVSSQSHWDLTSIKWRFYAYWSFQSGIKCASPVQSTLNKHCGSHFSIFRAQVANDFSSEPASNNLCVNMHINGRFREWIRRSDDSDTGIIV